MKTVIKNIVTTVLLCVVALPLQAKEQGRALYLEYCAACHGENLEGQTDWQTVDSDGALPAPPHDRTGHTWHHGDGLLMDYILLGGKQALATRGVAFESGMPGFEGTLSEAEAAQILDYIKSTWSERMRAFQEERTAAEAG